MATATARLLQSALRNWREDLARLLLIVALVICQTLEDHERSQSRPVVHTPIPRVCDHEARICNPEIRAPEVAFVLDQLTLESALQEVPWATVPFGKPVGVARCKILHSS